MVARAIQPGLVEPIYFVKNFNYISDTEASLTIEEKPVEKFHESLLAPPNLVTTFGDIDETSKLLTLDVQENAKTFNHLEL